MSKPNRGSVIITSFEDKTVGWKSKMDATFWHLLLLLHLLLLYLGVSDIKVVASQSIIKNLPGFSGDLPFKLETGYVGVGEKDDIQLFYYFIESETSPKDDPLVLWITGGPGCSGFSTLIYETGPFTITPDKSRLTLQLNPYAWTKIANIILLDQPVGTGYSYATSREAYYTSDTLSAKTTYNFLKKWLMSHPKFIKNPLYIAGNSYSGIVLPAIIQEIINGNGDGDEPPIMNLKGYILGNPFTDPHYEFNSKIEFSFQHALISHQLYKSAEANCKGEYSNIDPSNVLCLNDYATIEMCWNGIWLEYILESDPCTRVLTEDSLNIIHSVTDDQLPNQRQCHDSNSTYGYIWANDQAVQSGLHIREGTVKEFLRCNNSIRGAISYTKDVKSSIHYHQNFIHKGYRVLVYSGDLDLGVAYFATQRWIEAMNLTIVQPWRPWLVDGEVAGYTVLYTNEEYQHNVTFATFKGAGHIVPEYKPKEYFAMAARWFAHNPL